ncbi:TetR/AcrR family transcriptional regulator [Rheinheimera hassiensis]|uniref:acrylate utilization transcriptional regulator AcuR n=1 Tax=Rheinheimera hassiensis TaxID=1193627 RepID=UPI001F05D26D|nr:TetR/AcrR family transcriptional regulator [Rheinheimera hassiensis]
MTKFITTPRRGRPPKSVAQQRDIRAELIRSGLEHLTEIGFTASGLDKILKNVGVPKGSFYFYFNSKEAFGHAVLDSYANYFASKLDSCLLDNSFSPLQRIRNFVDDARHGIARHQFKRGCLVGNLGQEVDVLPESFRPVLIAIFKSWQQRIAACLREAQLAGELAPAADCDALAEFFWIGWEGAVSRSRLEQSTKPLDRYLALFIQGFGK